MENEVISRYSENNMFQNCARYCQHELHFWIYLMSKLLNTSEIINTINSQLHIISEA
jgi:hypothetical protein